MQQVQVYWVDARSEDGWTEQKDVEPRLAHITTLGYRVKETDEVLCVAASVDDATDQVSGIMFIPKQCILWRVVVHAVAPRASDVGTSHFYPES